MQEVRMALLRHAARALLRSAPDPSRGGSYTWLRCLTGSSLLLAPPEPANMVAAVHHNPAEPSKIRSLCIIAHIDHGKTTLADQLLRQAHAISARSDVHAGAPSSAAQQLAGETGQSLDSGDLERERGITILSKVTSFMYKVSPCATTVSKSHALISQYVCIYALVSQVRDHGAWTWHRV